MEPLALAASSVLHAFYFTLLTGAYRKADLSFVYPYARGVGTVIAVVGGLLFFLETPSALGWAGIALTVLATFMEALFGGRSRKGISREGRGLTLLTGLAIAGYLLVDKFGVAHVAAVPYLGLLFLGCAVLLAPRLLAGGRAREEWKRSKKNILAAAFFLFSGYVVILLAMESSPVSYVVAARATGIIASGLAGMFFFSEEVSRARWAAIALIAAGVACIGLA